MSSATDTGPNTGGGTPVGGYLLQELIGRGGMGEVYRGWDSQFERPVAMKCLPPILETSPIQRQRFQRGVRAAARVVHPFVATVFDLVEDRRGLFLIMEYCAGEPLDRRLRRGPIAAADAARIARELIEALEAIHSQGIVHRDIKPGNVLFTTSGHVKLADFGIAIELAGAVDRAATTEAEVTGRPVPIGTSAYMAPEQLENGRADRLTDLFSLGITLFELMTGEHPFRRGSSLETAHAILHEPPGRPAARRNLLRRGRLGRAVIRLLQKDPAARIQSAPELLAELSGAPAADRRRWNRGWLWLGTAITVALASCAIVLRAGAEARPLDSPREKLAVLPFAVETREGADLPEAGRSLATMIATRLADSAAIGPVDPARVDDLILALPATASDRDRLEVLTSNLKLRWAVRGTLSHESGEERARFDLIDAIGGAVLASSTATAPDLQRLAMALVDSILRAVGALLPVVPSADGMSADPITMKQWSEGERAHREGDWGRAVDLLGEAVKRDPRFLRGWTDLAGALFDLGREREARESSSHAVELLRSARLSDDSRLALETRAIDARVRYSGEEIGLRKRLYAANPDDTSVAIEYARALLKEGREIDLAAAVLEAARKIDPLDPLLGLSTAKALSKLSENGPALEELDRTERLFGAIRLQAGTALVAMERGNALFAADRFADAEQAYTSAARLAATAGLGTIETSATLQRANMLARQHRPSEASVLYEVAHQLAERDGAYSMVVTALNGRGLVQNLLGHYEAAERLYLQAISEAERLGSRRAGLIPLSNYTAMLKWIGRNRDASDRAAALAASGEELNDLESVCFARLVQCDLAQLSGDTTTAIDAMRQVMKYETQLPYRAMEASSRLVTLLLDSSRPLEAEKVWSKLIELGSRVGSVDENARFQAKGAAIAVELGDRSTAERRLDEARRLAAAASNRSTATAVEIAFAERKQQVEAQRWDAITALPLESDDASLATLRARAEQFAGRWERAVDLATRTLGRGDLFEVDRIALELLRCSAPIKNEARDRKLEAVRDLAERAQRGGFLLLAAEAEGLACGLGEIPACTTARERLSDYLDRFPSTARLEQRRRWQLQRIEQLASQGVR